MASPRRILAIDVGLYNMAAAVLTDSPSFPGRPMTQTEMQGCYKKIKALDKLPQPDPLRELPRPVACVFWKVEPIVTKRKGKPSAAELCVGLRSFLTGLSLDSCTDILIESQMTRKFAQLEFAILYHCLEHGFPARSISARTKFSHLGMPSSLKYSQRKSWAVHATLGHLVKTKEVSGNMAGYFLSQKKKDDLADAYLMALNVFYQDVALRMGGAASDEAAKCEENAALMASGVVDEETSGTILVDNSTP